MIQPGGPGWVTTGHRPELEAAVGAIALVDHHVHPALATELSLAELEELITESDRPVPPGRRTGIEQELERASARRAPAGPPWAAPTCMP